MKQDDFVLKQIDLLGKILGKIISDLLNIKNNSEIFDVYQFVSENLKKELNLELDVLLDLDENELLALLTIENHFDTNNIEKIADLFYLLGKNSSLQKTDLCLQKSLQLLNYVNSISNTYSFERINKISRILSLTKQ
jgi:hypothetical protein